MVLGIPTTIALYGSKIATVALMVFGFLMTGEIRSPPSSTVATIEQNLIIGFNRFTKCGMRADFSAKFRSIPEERILGGDDANEGDWPWMGYLYLNQTGKYDGFLCGATLISSEWVVTAAHCILFRYSPEKYKIVLGERSVSVNSGNEREFEISQIIIHGNYSSLQLNNDIALLKLSKPVLYTRYIRPLCLAPQGFPTDATVVEHFDGKLVSYAGKKCTALGWGETETKHKSDTLQQLEVLIFPRLICKGVTQRSRSSYASEVKDDSAKFCAYGGEGQDTCNGDSGGPLLCLNDEDGKYYLHGITSYGPTPCGQDKLPGVYTKVSTYHNWIGEMATL